MKLDFSISINGFEPITAVAEQRLVGGFSGSFSAYEGTTIESEQSNNCLGGNCADGCGIIGPANNYGCNTYSGCGHG